MAVDVNSEVTREWLLTNGRGGFASGTPIGVNTRRYHGLLVASAHPPLERWMLLSNVLEKVTVHGKSVELASFEFDGAMHPRGFEFLTGFETSNNPDEPWAQFIYEIDRTVITKRIVMPRDRDEVHIEYQITAGPKSEIRFELAPFVPMRDFHHLTQEFEGGFAVDPCKAAAIVHAWRGGPRVWLSGRNETSGQAMQFEHLPDWWRGLYYREEAHRGQDCREDLFVPGWFSTSGAGTLNLTFIARALFNAAQSAPTEPAAHPSRRSAAETEARVSSVGASNDKQTARAINAASHNRKSEIGNRQSPSGDSTQHSTLSTQRSIERRLLDAADSFIVRRERSDGRPSKTIVAGYHWFGDWGRDTFIAMPGLLFETKRFDEARGILETFASVQRNGLIPNRFTDYGEGCDYNSVDASMWYLHAATLYFELTGDLASWTQTLYPCCRTIVEQFEQGTEFDIRLDSDGLISAGNPSTQLTWMDAKFGDTAFTPRNGKPVEINALWYHGLRMLEKQCLQVDSKDAGHYDRLADKAEASFVKAFWNERANYLYDVVRTRPGQTSPGASEGEASRHQGSPQSAISAQSAAMPKGLVGGSELADASIRPNQIFAVSLTHSMLSPAQQQLVLDCVSEHLLTPYGLRSLAPKDPAYRPRCEGNPFKRDSAYHQGTVWGWLIGPYVEAYLRVNEFSVVAKADMRKHLQPLIAHLDEAGIGSVSEIFDGDPPHTPRGCIAQAWSVSELLRAWRMTELE